MKRFVPSSTYWAGAMRTRKSLVLPAGGLIAVIAVVGLTVAQPRAGEAAQNRAQIDLVIQIRCPDGKCRTSLEDLSKRVLSNIGSSGQDGVRRFVPDSFFDIYYLRNIGSSGQDGVSASFDSFFDITYQIELRTIETEIIAMQLRGTYPSDLNPALLIDLDGLRIATGGDVTYGHVTVLK